MANPYINQQEQSLYEGFVNQALSKEKNDSQDIQRQRNTKRLEHFIHLRQYYPESFKSDQGSKLFNNIDATYEDENIDGKNVTVARVNNVTKDYRNDAGGYYEPNKNYILTPRGTSFIKGSKENAQQVLDHEIVHASRRENLKNYRIDLPWRDRPEEVYAEAGSLEKFKKRLQVMGIEYTPEMGTRYLSYIQTGRDVSSNKAPIKAKPNSIPRSNPLTLDREILVDPESRLQEIINQRESGYSIGRLPNIALFDTEFRAKTDDYKDALSSVRIAYGTHPLLAGKK